MPKIITLSSDVVTKIAAGEVIERPAYAVKELIENSIDAGATSIIIDIEDSGLRRIQVIDNGEGMSKEDLQQCFLPHTTSKIKEAEELLGIKTLGFRGEALASIAAISNLSIKSREKTNPSGNLIEIYKGEIETIEPIGMPVGTIITVDDLFYPVPARKKFLKSKKTEFRHITEIVLQYALLCPTIHFVLTHNKKVIFDLPLKKEVHERIPMLFGNDLFEHVIPLSFEESFIKLSGFLGKPQISSSQNQKQYIFINGRRVSDTLISLAVKESYGTLLPVANTPVFFLYIGLPFEIVDVNVHPRKEQVSFINARMIFDAVKQAVTQTLADNNITFRLSQFSQEPSLRKGETRSFAGELLKEVVLPWDRTDIGERLRKLQLIQIQQTYLLLQTKKGLVIYDQHAMHERILFEQFVNAFETQKKKKENYELRKPITLQLSITEVQLFDEYKKSFEEIGFEIEHFQGESFVIRTVPILFKGRNVEKVIKEMLIDLSQDLPKSMDMRTKRMLAFLACRSAVKAGDTLAQKQMEKMIGDLEKTPNNVTCPHGRPTKLAVDLGTLHKYFKRL